MLLKEAKQQVKHLQSGHLQIAITLLQNSYIKSIVLVEVIRRFMQCCTRFQDSVHLEIVRGQFRDREIVQPSRDGPPALRWR